MMRVVRTKNYHDDLNRIEERIAKDNPMAGADMWLHIDKQVDGLADPNFPRRPWIICRCFVRPRFLHARAWI